MVVMNVKTHGFEGIFFPAGRQKDKAVITITGSDGGIRGAQKIAQFYASQGLSALAVAYFKTRQTPRTLSSIPIEYIESAVKWLKAQGYEKIAVDGISKGAELALLTASLIPDISCVIARSPSYFVCEGLCKKGPTNTSSWSWCGEPLPYARYTERRFYLLRTFLHEGEFSVIKYYRNIPVPETAVIPVEKINGPVLLLSSSIDTTWPSSENGAKIIDRLADHSFPYAFCHEIFDTVSHYITPMDIPAVKLLSKAERLQPDACSQSRKRANELTLDWIHNVWK